MRLVALVFFTLGLLTYYTHILEHFRLSVVKSSADLNFKILIKKKDMRTVS